MGTHGRTASELDEGRNLGTAPLVLQPCPSVCGHRFNEYHQVFNTCLRCRDPDSERHWVFYPNGDLWQGMGTSLQSRGKHSIALVKMHAHKSLDETINLGMTREQWIGNSVADALADRGRDSVHHWRSKYFGLMIARRQQINRLVRAIQSMQVAILLANTKRGVETSCLSGVGAREHSRMRESA